jgi:hypothetical protein
MTRFEASTAYWMMWLPSLTYGISCTTMDCNQLDAIQKPMVNDIIPKMGYSSKTSLNVVFGSRRYLSIGI